MADAIDELIKSREQKLFLTGMWASALSAGCWGPGEGLRRI